jgi:hypothetical protein
MNHGNEIRIGDIWGRREPIDGDPYNRVLVGGLVDESLAGRPNEWTLKSADEFCETIQTEAAGLLDHCTLVWRVDEATGDWGFRCGLRIKN